MAEIDYDDVIADLEAKRAAINASIDAAIQGITHARAAMAAFSGLTGVQHLALPHIASTATVGPPAATVEPSTFFGLGVAEAALKYLATIKRQQSTREIADALEAAHYHHTSQNFPNTVNTALYRRERVEADVVKIDGKWALAEWYPGRRRRTEKEQEPPRQDKPNDAAT